MADENMSEFGSSTSGKGILRPRARLLRTVGDELISSDIVAILELVKNAYDADATNVLIRFHEPLITGQGQVEIIDNGHGMTSEIIQGAWLEPATSFKKRQSSSRYYKRRFLGEKGIGRFAASKLANYLEVITRSTGSSQELRVFFDWSQFDDDQKFLDEVQVQWEERLPIDIKQNSAIQRSWMNQENQSIFQSTHGTILRMNSLRSEWNENKLSNLRKDLARLVSPFFDIHRSLDSEPDPFRIYLDLPERFAPLSGLVEAPEALKNPHYSISGNVEFSGHYDLSMHLRGHDENRMLVGTFLLRNGHIPQCGPFSVDFRIWDRDSLGDIASKYSVTSAQIKKDLDAAAGVNIYRDGFRVLPYGEPQNDWLELNQRRVNNPTLRLSNNQIVGYILVSSDKNPGLRDQSNREGIVQSQALDDLRELVINILMIIEKERYKIRQTQKNEQSTDMSGEGLFTNFTLIDIHNMVLGQYPQDSALLDLISEKERDLEQRVEKVQTVLSRYFNLATLGTMVDTVLHEGRTPVTKIKNQTQIGRKRIKQHKADDCEMLLKLLDQDFSFIDSHVDILTTVFRRIEPFSGRKRGKSASASVEKAIKNAVAVLETDIGKAHVRVEVPQKTDTIFTFDQSQLQSIIINLMQNSLYWLREIPKEERRVVIQVVKPNPEDVEIIFSDSGPGVPSEDQDHIFEPYFSKKIDGTGLGLTIVGSLVHDYYNGTLDLVDNGPLPGATFRITLHGGR